MPAAVPAASITDRTDENPMQNGWGGAKGTTPLYFHPDGPVGTAVRSLGDDAQLAVDGHSLGNHLGLLATDVVNLRVHPQDALDRLKNIRDRLPAGHARRVLDRTIADLDAPPAPPPPLPAGTPQPLGDLADQLNRIPLVRHDFHAQTPAGELARVQRIATDFAAGRVGGLRLIREVQQLATSRHESSGCSGTFHIIDTANRAAERLTAMRAANRSSLNPTG